MNTHYGVIMFTGDPDEEHPDIELRGKSPHLELIAVGPEQFCWESLDKWTIGHPLRQWESAEVVMRNPSVVIREISTSTTPTPTTEEGPSDV